ncbi:hypothetical protein [Desulfocurvibacter africanus]|uniref:hypothetical protein n=1 Tax=Desulfocurvibacter africanus TaxID=873 RepID=UPI0003FB1F91|nr:hypothetical protein [Desulfocurvibacter africanus]
MSHGDTGSFNLPGLSGPSGPSDSVGPAGPAERPDLSTVSVITDLAGLADLADPRELERRLDGLAGIAEARHKDYLRATAELAEISAFLELAPKAEALLEKLSQSLFGELLDEIEANLTQAIREILSQDRVVKSDRETKGGRLHVSFRIENQGQVEDILVGQGGSVCNILSVSLRLIALSQLDPTRHRPFLVLDEQDCWLKPELVPTFMKLIRTIAERLGLQVLVISHHPLDLFATQAEIIYGLAPCRDNGVSLTRLKGGTAEAAQDG